MKPEITLLDYFAGQALIALSKIDILSVAWVNEKCLKIIAAEEAYKIAEAMVVESNKRKKKRKDFCEYTEDDIAEVISRTPGVKFTPKNGTK
jgi:hypothetical protein